LNERAERIRGIVCTLQQIFLKHKTAKDKLITDAESFCGP